ncbi:unnamed protein product [Clonostachys rhizophaga]|uniref:Clr5 domain-containing protein n=1 Tax=Clonostachys rhizophaga TaxID=160324 RepID=A0A9N9YRV4_9HYPO|nr:unnamed protein product [Clonostachys rhizophaga]
MPRPPLKSKDAWEAQKERIHSLYIVNNRTLQETIEKMKVIHGFDAKEYVKRLNSWGMFKNAKMQDWKHVRDRDLDKRETRVSIGGKVISCERVKRATRRYKFAPNDDSRSSSSDRGMLSRKDQQDPLLGKLEDILGDLESDMADHGWEAGSEGIPYGEEGVLRHDVRQGPHPVSALGGLLVWI